MVTREQAVAVLGWLSAITSFAIASYGVYQAYKRRST